MKIYGGRFDEPKKHHAKWFEYFRFDKSVEIWFGQVYLIVEWGE